MEGVKWVIGVNAVETEKHKNTIANEHHNTQTVIQLERKIMNLQLQTCHCRGLKLTSKTLISQLIWLYFEINLNDDKTS